MSWFSTILTGILIGAFFLEDYQYHHGYLPTWQALAFWAGICLAWVILIRSLHTTSPNHHDTT
jgi:hypothetical protein